MVLADQELMQANDLALFLDISAKEILEYLGAFDSRPGPHPRALPLLVNLRYYMA